MKSAPVAAQRIEVSSLPVAETIAAHGCSIVLRRVDGPEARELHFHCQPTAAVADPGRQANALYRAILGVLDAEGGGFGSIVSETVFIRDLRTSIQSVREARHRALAAHGGTTHRPAAREIQQPPLNDQAALEVSVQAVLPKR